jgi:hypothetical protein
MSNKMQNTDEFLSDLLHSAKFDAIPAKYDGMSQDEYREVVVKAISERIAADYIPKHHSFVHDSSLFDGNGTPLCYVCSMPNVYHKAGVKVFTEAEVAAEEASLIGDIARAVGILQGLGYPDEYLEKRLAALTPQASEGEKT